MTAQLKKILVVCLDNIGDLVFTSGVCIDLKKAYPSAEISVWCKHYTQSVGERLPGISHVFAADSFWDKSPGHGKGSLKDFIAMIRRLRREHFDLAVVTSKQWRVAASAFLIGAKRRVGYAKDAKSKFFLTDVANESKECAVVAHGTLLAALNIPGGTRHTSLHKKTTGRNPRNHTVVLHPFAGSVKRCWPLDRWIALADVLRENGKRILWIGQKHELDLLEARLTPDQKQELFRSSEGMNALVELLENVDFYIGHDSGPLHVAHAFGAKVIGLYLPGEPERTGPQGAADSILLHKDSPGELTVEEVVEAANGIFLSN